MLLEDTAFLMLLEATRVRLPVPLLGEARDTEKQLRTLSSLQYVSFAKRAYSNLRVHLPSCYHHGVSINAVIKVRLHSYRSGPKVHGDRGLLVSVKRLEGVGKRLISESCHKQRESPC